MYQRFNTVVVPSVYNTLFYDVVKVKNGLRYFNSAAPALSTKVKSYYQMSEMSMFLTSYIQFAVAET